MTWIDYAVIAIIGISVLLSVIHGLVREILALASWVVAFIVAQMFAGDVAALLPAALTNPSLRLLAGFLAVFLAVLVAMTLVAIGVSGLIKSAGLGFADRALGRHDAGGILAAMLQHEEPVVEHLVDRVFRHHA